MLGRPQTSLLVTALLLQAFAGHTASLLLPLSRRDGGLLARGLLRNASLPLHGSVKQYGYFYATVQLGSPPREFAVIVDTGSTVTYVPCASCGNSCGANHQDAAFDPAASSTSRDISCDSELCQCGHFWCGCKQETKQCTYTRSYAEQSSSKGLLIQDDMQLGEGGVPIIFGCETEETGEIYNQIADGLMGLGNSEISVVNQLVAGGLVDDTFSLCFGSVEGDGALLLGDVEIAPYTQNFSYTPLVSRRATPNFYTVDMEAMHVNSTALPVAMADFNVGYGTVLDSGTTFAYLPTRAFDMFRKQIAAHVEAQGLRPVQKPDPSFDDICYGLVPSLSMLSSYFPSADLHFRGGSTVHLEPINYLYVHPVVEKAYCLGIFDNGHAGTLLGGIIFRDILVQYDRRHSRVGFVPAPCQAIGKGALPCTSPAGTSVWPFKRAPCGQNASSVGNQALMAVQGWLPHAWSGVFVIIAVIFSVLAVLVALWTARPVLSAARNLLQLQDNRYQQYDPATDMEDENGRRQNKGDEDQEPVEKSVAANERPSIISLSIEDGAHQGGIALEALGHERPDHVQTHLQAGLSHADPLGPVSPRGAEQL